MTGSALAGDVGTTDRSPASSSVGARPGVRGSPGKDTGVVADVGAKAAADGSRLATGAGGEGVVESGGGVACVGAVVTLGWEPHGGTVGAARLGESVVCSTAVPC